MAKMERVREVPTRLLDADYLRERTEAGWKLVAIEWQRTVEGGEGEARGLVEEIPFGLRVAEDCSRLEEDPTEKEILMLMMDLIVDDYPLSKVAEELNRRRFRTRQGSPWSAVAVFNMLPRLIEVGPRIFSSDEWAERRRRLLRMSDGSAASDRRLM
jgi:recombinase